MRKIFMEKKCISWSLWTIERMHKLKNIYRTTKLQEKYNVLWKDILFDWRNIHCSKEIFCQHDLYSTQMMSFMTYWKKWKYQTSWNDNQPEERSIIFISFCEVSLSKLKCIWRKCKCCFTSKVTFPVRNRRDEYCFHSRRKSLMTATGSSYFILNFTNWRVIHLKNWFCTTFDRLHFLLRKNFSSNGIYTR